MFLVEQPSNSSPEDFQLLQDFVVMASQRLTTNAHPVRIGVIVYNLNSAISTSQVAPLVIELAGWEGPLMDNLVAAVRGWDIQYGYPGVEGVGDAIDRMVQMFTTGLVFRCPLYCQQTTPTLQ